MSSVEENVVHLPLSTIYWGLFVFALVLLAAFAVVYWEAYRNGLGRPLKPKHLDPEARYVVEGSMILLGRGFTVLSDADDPKDKFRWCKMYVQYPTGTLVVFKKTSIGNICCSKWEG